MADDLKVAEFWRGNSVQGNDGSTARKLSCSRR